MKSKISTCDVAAQYFLRFKAVELAVSNAVVIVRFAEQGGLLDMCRLAQPAVERDQPCVGLLVRRPAQLPTYTLANDRCARASARLSTWSRAALHRRRLERARKGAPAFVVGYSIPGREERRGLSDSIRTSM